MEGKSHRNNLAIHRRGRGGPEEQKEFRRLRRFTQIRHSGVVIPSTFVLRHFQIIRVIRGSLPIQTFRASTLHPSTNQPGISQKEPSLTASYEGQIRECGEKALIQKREQRIAREWECKIYRTRHEQNNRTDGRKQKAERSLVKRKMMRLFLIGTLFGVMITAAETYVFAIPANSDYWRMEIWKRGGAAWTYDKNGHVDWKWMVDPIPGYSQ